MATESDKVLAVVESLIFYHAESESGTSKYAGSKERVFLRYVTSFCRIKKECMKRGLGESLDVRICRLTFLRVITTCSGRAVQVRYFCKFLFKLKNASYIQG